MKQEGQKIGFGRPRAGVYNSFTFDIFAGYNEIAHQEALRWGKKEMTVYVLN